MKTVYGYLLRMLPDGYRELFEAEMAAVFEARLQDTRKHGSAAKWTFLISECGALVRRAWTERQLQREQGGAYLQEILLGEYVSRGDEPKRIQHLVRQIEYAIAHHDFVRARQYAFAEQRLRLYLSGAGNA